VSEAATVSKDDIQEDEVYSSKRAKTPAPGILTFFKRLIGYYPRTGSVPLEEGDTDDPILLDGNPLPYKSFLSHVPFSHFDHANGQVILKDEDGNIEKRGVFLEVLPADIEGREDEYIDGIADKIALALQAIPGTEEPWIIQIYINDEPITALIHEIKQYAETIDKKNRKDNNDQYRKKWFSLLEEHFNFISRREGIFTEKKSGMRWRARYRRTRIVIYNNNANIDPKILNGQTLRFVEALNEAGITSILRNSEDLYEWLMPWYSGEKEKAYEYMARLPYPLKDEKLGNMTASHDIGEMCLRSRYVTASAEKKCWIHGKRLTRFITLEPPRSVPKSAHWNREGGSGGSAAFDRLPDGAILMTTLVVQPQDRVEGDIVKTQEASLGDSQDAKITKDECKRTLTLMAYGNRLSTVFSGIYIDALTEDELEQRTAVTIAAVNAANFDVIEPEADPLILDSYVRGLPMAFVPKNDARVQRRARKAWEPHVSRVMPFYCRGRGTANPGWLFNSRDGEPTLMDPLGDDRTKNAHMIMLGGTGSGKTSTLISMLLNTMAIHRPRLFLITALPTFYLFGDFAKANGLSVNRVQITSNNLPSLPPFADITKSIIDKENEKAGIEELDEFGEMVRKRNYIGEAEVAANLMITGGNKQEESDYKAQHRALVKQGIVLAAENVHAEGREQALTEDVSNALRSLAEDESRSANEREILSQYATIIGSFTSGMEGQLFNRPGELWPDSDITIIELGELAYKGNETKLAVAMSGLMSKINYEVEKGQFSGRNTIVVGDEGHILFKNPLIGPLLNTYIAMWRTYGGWFWLATQNLRQLPDSAKELLNQPEWWVCLNTDEDEVEQIARFKSLTNEQKKLLKATRKEKGKYIEGVVFSKEILTLIRNVPPSLALALAETEPDEKAHRINIAKDNDCSELQAAYIRAAEITALRSKADDE